MSALSERPLPLPTRRQVRAAVVAFGVAALGAVAAFGSSIVTFQFKTALGIVGTDIGTVLSVNAQIGFVVVVAGYLAVVDDWSGYLQFHLPSREDVAWVLATPILLGAAGVGVSVLLQFVGIPTPTHTGIEGTKAILLDQPALWLVAIPALYLFAAPAEELLYRGIVQERLRPQFGPVGAVVGAAVGFTLMHGSFALVDPPTYAINWVASTAVGGIVWGVVYEQTRNLVVTSVSHAMSWTVPFSLLPLL